MRQPISERPILDVPRTGLELLLDVAGVLALLGSYLTIALAWSKFPERIPTHFNAAGEVNGWGPRETLWIAPGVMTLVFVVLTIAARFPQRFNYPWPITAENAERQYRMARTLLAAVRLAVAFTCFFAVSAIRRATIDHVPFDAAFIPVALGCVPVLVVIYFVAASRAR